MEQSEISEFKVTARLVEENKEVATLEKCFGLAEIEDDEEEEQIPTKTIDETISEFLQEIESKVQELGRIVCKEELARVTVSTILFLVKRSQNELTLDIEVERQETEERKNGETNSHT